MVDSLRATSSTRPPNRTSPPAKTPSSWDGKDLTGVQRADGKVFGLRVTAKDAAGSNVGTYVSLNGNARSIETINGETVVDINGTKVPLNLITGVTASA